MSCSTCYKIRQGMPGFRLGQKIEGKCGMRASMTAELVFDGVEVGRRMWCARLLVQYGCRLD